ncbi:MAG TPA: phage tail protein, partial [Bacteroidetes bacterium]|nr:phage tail protein [Bacteroidota bacterium]
ISLKRGVFRNDSESYDWFKAIRTDDQARRNITITMLDSNNNPTIVWRVQNAWVSKLSTPSLNSGSSEAAIETMDVVCESYSMEIL